MADQRTISMKWRNLNLALRIKVSVGAALVLVYVPGFFLILLLSKSIQSVAANLLLVLSAWTAGVGGYAFHDYKQNALDVKAAKDGDVSAALTKIKLAKLGIQGRNEAACTTEDAKTKTSI